MHWWRHRGGGGQLELAAPKVEGHRHRGMIMGVPTQMVSASHANAEELFDRDVDCIGRCEGCVHCCWVGFVVCWAKFELILERRWYGERRGCMSAGYLGRRRLARLKFRLSMDGVCESCQCAGAA